MQITYWMETLPTESDWLSKEHNRHNDGTPADYSPRIKLILKHSYYVVHVWWVNNKEDNVFNMIDYHKKALEVPMHI